MLNGEKNREQHAVGLKSIPEKKQEVPEKGNNGVESTQATAESSIETTSAGITEAPTSEQEGNISGTYLEVYGRWNSPTLSQKLAGQGGEKRGR